MSPSDVIVLLLSVISIFSNSPSAGDFQPVCIGITLFLQPVGGVESPVCREGDGSAGELARGAQLGCHQPRWMVSPKGAAGSDPPSCCSGTVLMDQTASWSCGCSQGMLGDVSGVGPSCGEVTAMEHRWQQGQQVLPVLLRAWHSFPPAHAAVPVAVLLSGDTAVPVPASSPGCAVLGDTAATRALSRPRTAPGQEDGNSSAAPSPLSSRQVMLLLHPGTGR